jgi:class 3 adenylate cyclase/tetratricopeptide (TPR) repeat protein
MSVSLTCSQCGSENEPDARFCRSCAAGLSPSPPLDPEVRKVVTVLFSDVTDSTRLGQELDPEAVRRLVSRYFDEMKVVLEGHGGAVEKFIGDAVMAVFGVPQVHEDDALRAVRAALDMRDELRRLNEEFRESWGVTLAARTGLYTGEVIAGDPGRGQSFVVGDTVNTASRLETAAQPGEILIGEATYRLVGEAVSAEDVGPLMLKGKQEPVRAFRVLEIDPSAPGWTRRLDSPLVGREQQLALLEQTLQQRTGEGEAGLVTLMGVAGVGKSRLSGEFLSRIGGRATVLRGRCLPYGDGITFWPIAAVLREATGIDDRDPPEQAESRLSELLDGDDDAALVAERLATLLGGGVATPGIQETFWAVRKLFERLGTERPLVVVFDDIHWGEPTFLDLLEYLADRIRTAPVVLMCLARPELLETRPGWMSTKHNATLISLDPLTEDEIDGLIGNLTGGAELEQEARARITEVAEGNPLFVEETLRMLVDDGILRRQDGTWTLAGDLSGLAIPPTIHALLTARLDRLDREERAVMERAAIVGRVFSLEAVAWLSPAEIRPTVILRLQSLSRKELVRPDYTEIGESFRFAHILIRDAAYSAIPKADRAELHERFADFIELEARELSGEYEEIVGYHLDQAQRLLLELGPASGRTAQLGARAAAVLASAGRRAFGRGDMSAAVKLLSRAAALLPEEDAERAELLPQLAFALFETGDFARLQDVVAETRKTAAASGNSSLEAYAVILGLWIEISWAPEGWADAAQREAATAIFAFEAARDDRGLAKAWALLGLVYLVRAQFAGAEQAWEKAAEHAQKAGDRRDELESLSWVPLVVWAGPTHTDRGLERCGEIAQRARGDKKVTASALIAQAAFEAGQGRFDEARALIRRAKGLLEEVALTVWLAGPLAQFAGWVELLAGDPAAAERELRWGYDKLKEIGELSWLSTTAALLAEAVYLVGRPDEAEELTRASEESAGAEDRYSHALLRSVRAKVLAARGETKAAEPLARESVALADETDFLDLRWQARIGNASVLRSAGHGDEARAVLGEAAEIAERKGNLVAARRARELLARADDMQRASGAGDGPAGP